MRLGTILYALWATGIGGWFIYAAMMGTSPFASNAQRAVGPGIYGPGHK